MRLLAFAASHREESVNRALVRCAMREAETKGATVDFREFREFDMPLYDDDVFLSNGLPEGAERLKDAIEAADGMMLAIPEYNWSYPGTIKNAIDWISRARPVPLDGKTCLLLAASPSIMGGIKGLLHFRVPLEALGTYVYPKMFTLNDAYRAFNSDEHLVEDMHRKRLADIVGSFVTFAEKNR